MTASKKLILMALFAALILSLTGCAQKEIKRVGMVVQLNDEHMDAYKKLHADSNPGVRDLLTKYNMANFSIFLHEIDGKWYEFGYYEYVGDDFEADMAALDAEPRNKEWLKICDPMQIPLEGETGWAVMERVYFNE
ncbi:MAG: L-rhamnose mutarotase [Planctomycetota bacterium]|jgi:L-rhamnose mutarotase